MTGLVDHFQHTTSGSSNRDPDTEEHGSESMKIHALTTGAVRVTDSFLSPGHGGRPQLNPRRVDFALFMVEAPENDELIHEASSDRRPPDTLHLTEEAPHLLRRRITPISTVGRGVTGAWLLRSRDNTRPRRSQARSLAIREGSSSQLLGWCGGCRLPS
jgi:hypothetical protein